MAADVNVVAHLCAAAQQRLAGGDFTKYGDADVERTTRRVAAHQFAAVGIGQGKQPLGKRRQPGVVGMGQGEGQGEGQRLSAAGGEVAQVHRQRFVAQRLGVDVGEKVPAFDQQVGRDGELHARARRQQGAVVAHAQRRAAHWALEMAGDEFKFTHGRGGIGSSKQV